jgi:hypothetical protein
MLGANGPEHSIRPWLGLGMLAVVLFALVTLSDRPIAELLRSVRTPGAVSAAKGLSLFGAPVPYLVVSLGTFVACKLIGANVVWGNRALFALLAATTAGIWTDLLKVFFRRPRPELYFAHNLHGFQPFNTDPNFWSFPFGAFGGGGRNGCRAIRSHASLPGEIPARAVMVASRRVALGIHYPSDCYCRGSWLGFSSSSSSKVSSITLRSRSVGHRIRHLNEQGAQRAIAAL